MQSGSFETATIGEGESLSKAITKQHLKLIFHPLNFVLEKATLNFFSPFFMRILNIKLNCLNFLLKNIIFN